MEDRRALARWWTLVGATLIALYLCWLMFKPFVAVIGWATVLVIVFYPVHERLARRLGKPALSAILSCILVILLILVPITLITLAILRELSGALQTLQAASNYLLDPNSPVTGPLLRFIGRFVDISQFQTEDYVLEQLKGMSGSIAGRTLGFLGGVLGVFVQMLFVVFTMYYLFKDGERIANSVRDALPLERAQADALMTRTREVIDASVYGVISIAVIQGTLGGLAFWVLGLPSAIVWGVTMTFLSMIPMLGAFLVWVPAAIYLAVMGQIPKAIILAVWGTLVIGMIDNFLRPKLVGGRTRLHELLIFFAVLGGLQVFGVLGFVLGPVVLAVCLALIDVFRSANETGDHRV